MPAHDQALRSTEYATLRDEILQNKKFIFERPLLIITAAAAVTFRLSEEPSLALLPALFVFVLLSNLWFTVNRLRSNARIIAYISLVLEPASTIRWIGWENSLRMYRIWKKRTEPEEAKQRVARYFRSQAIPDAMAFYPALWMLHLAAAVIAVASSVFATLAQPHRLSISAMLLTIAISAVFCRYCFGPDTPKKMRDLIEVQRATWNAVFEDVAPAGAFPARADTAFSPEQIT